MKNLIVTLAALWVLAPAIAVAGGGNFDEQHEEQMMQKTIVIENHVPPSDNGTIVAAVIAGLFGLAGTIYLARRKS